MSYTIEVRELRFDDKYHEIHTFNYSDFFGLRTLGDVKNYVVDKCLELNDPLCTCFLKIKKFSKDKTYIEDCYYYSDNTTLNKTEFSENNPIKVCYDNKKCNCGKYEQLKMYSELNKKSKENEKKWEEKERKNKEYYENMIKRQTEQQQSELNRLQNLIDEQRKR